MTTKTEQRHTIWTNDLDYDKDWKDDIKEDYPDVTDNQCWEIMHQINADYLDDERCNLDIQLSRPILAIADLGLWNGRTGAYKEISSGNISDCLYAEKDCEYSTWYVDELGDLRYEGIHHDGRNHILYRAYKDNVSDLQIENLQWKIYCGKATRRDITRVTRRLGDDIAAVYGWKLPRMKKVA